MCEALRSMHQAAEEEVHCSEAPPAVHHSPAAGLGVMKAVVWARGAMASGAEGCWEAPEAKEEVVGWCRQSGRGQGALRELWNAWNGRQVPDMSQQRVGPACCGLAAGCPTRRGPARTPGGLLCAGRQGVAGTGTECKAAGLCAAAGWVRRRRVSSPPSAATQPLCRCH